MDFLKKVFGNNTSNTASGKQENFVVDETGNANEASFTAPVKVSNYTSQPTPATHAPAPVSNHVSNVASAPLVPQSSAAENASQSDGEYVGDTSAFDELMKQAESSVDARVLDQPVLDPEFQKAKDELESEGGIEIFPAE